MRNDRTMTLRCDTSPGSLLALRTAVGCLLVATSVGSTGCASDPAPAAAVAASLATDRKTQDPLPLTCDAKVVKCWQSEVDKQPALKDLAAAVGKPVQAAGTISDGAGNTLLWAELAATPEAPRTEVSAVFARCNSKNVCTVGRADYTATGATFSDASGKPLTDVAIGKPVLRKKIKAHAPDKDPTLLAPIELSAKPDAEAAWATFSQVQLKKRRVVILNAYGPEVGLDAKPIATAAKASGRFDTVDVIDYARSADLFAVVPTLTPLDVLVWVGAGVYEDRTEGARHHGLTLSRGVFGDEFVYGKLVANLTKGVPLGGPGLIVLAGADTLVPKGWEEPSSLAIALHDVPARALVGFAGKIAASEVVAASARLLGSVMGGAALDVAVKAASPAAVSDMAQDVAQKWKWAESSAKFWGAKSPSKASMKLFADLDSPYCTQSFNTCNRAELASGYGKDPVPTGSLTAGNTTYFCPNLVIDGPFFSCDVDDPAVSQKFLMRGVMRGHAENDRFWVFVLGTGITKYKDLLVIGEGVFHKIDEGGGSSSLKFDGDALAGTWVDEENRCCSIKGGSALKSHQGDMSVLQIWP